MKALVKYARGEGNMEIREVPEPSPDANQVKIEVKGAGICGSDLHIYHDEIDIPIRTPVVVGHEFCGVIVEVGSGVSDWHVGDRVTGETAFSVCERCEYCRTGNYNLCTERKGIGFWFNGAFTKYVVIPDKRLHRLPDNVDFVSGALCEPLSVVIHGAIELSRIDPGDTVLVSGMGAIGLLAAQVARSEGARVIISGTSQDAKRFDLARSLGFEECVNVEQEDLTGILETATRGRGVDVVLECSGAPEAARVGLEVIKKQGVYAQIGLFGMPFEINFEKIAYKELRVSGCFSQRWTAWERSLKLLERGVVKTRPLVTDILPIERWEEGYRKFETKESTKVVLIPQ
ncbi:MAG: zinc-binding dehydrogenase [Deltaproteobacteria bacterium]|nr:zinc-binding dehydrogenase [Deltaproteobacteria bacterium]MBW2123347.1 zinc-binding dehydrogenase [Deltaproteobacteria bacterium]